MLAMFRTKTQAPRAGLPLQAIGIRVAAVGSAILSLYALYSVVWMAVSAAVGIAVLGTIALGGFVVVSALPLLAQVLENWVLKQRKAAARANPVEQLQNIHLLRTRQVDGQREAAKAMAAQIRTMENMIVERKRQGKDTAANEAALGALKVAFNQKIEKIKYYDAGLARMKDQIEDVEFQQKFAKVHADAKAAAGSAEDEATNAILAQEALAASNESFNKIFADLDVDSATLNSIQQLEYAPGKTIDLAAIEVPTLQPVRS